jgi:hypothetical protein
VDEQEKRIENNRSSDIAILSITNKHMNATQREIFRETVLRAFKAAAGCGLSLPTLDVALRACGFKGFAAEEIEAEVQYFMDKGFVAEVAKSHSLGNRIWRITAAGTDDLERRGL